MFTNVDLHTVKEYHDTLSGDTEKLAGDQELAIFSFEKRDGASSVGFEACKSCVVDLRRCCGDEGCHDDNPECQETQGKHPRSVVERDVDM